MTDTLFHLKTATENDPRVSFAFAKITKTRYHEQNGNSVPINWVVKISTRFFAEVPVAIRRSMLAINETLNTK